MRLGANVVILALTVFVLAPDGAAEPGPHKVGATYFVALDASRSHQNGSPRPIPIVAFYPADANDFVEAPTARYPVNPFVPMTFFHSTDWEARGLDSVHNEPTPSPNGPFPLIVVSNGARAPYWYQIGYASRLASYGFVVALMAHYGEAAYAAPSPADPLLHAAQRGLDRIYDMMFVVETVIARSANASDLIHGLVDETRVAGSGHSFGGLTAMQVIGGDDIVCDTYAAPNPPVSTCVEFPGGYARMNALVLLEGSSPNLKWHELQRIDVPTIILGSDVDSLEVQFGSVIAMAHARAHAAIQGKPNYRVDILRSRHVPHFTNACQSVLVRGDIGILTPTQVQSELNRLQCFDPTLTPFAEGNAIVARYAVAFLKTVLTGEQGYEEVLTPGWALTREPDAMFFVTEKRNGQAPDTEFPEDPNFWFFTTQSGEQSQAAKDHAEVFDTPDLATPKGE